MNIPSGCSFNPRCRYAQDICRVDPPPPLREVGHHRFSACHFAELLLAHSPELEVTQTPDEVEAALEFGRTEPGDMLEPEPATHEPEGRGSLNT